jgi:hypothetical protein
MLRVRRAASTDLRQACEYRRAEPVDPTLPCIGRLAGTRVAERASVL